MASQTEENYLKALFSLMDDQNEVSLSELSKALNVKTPTVNSMVKKFYQKGLLDYEKYKPLKLTSKGKLQAAFIIRKHRLTEMFLVEKMGFGWEEVHEIAEQIEHVKSTIFFDRMDELLGFPKVDPHGSPIPDKTGTINRQSYKKLSDCKIGQIVKLSALSHSSSEFLQFLNTRELSLDTILEIKSKELFDGSMIISYTNHPSEMLSQIASEKLLVELA